MARTPIGRFVCTKAASAAVKAVGGVHWSEKKKWAEPRLSPDYSALLLPFCHILRSFGFCFSAKNTRCSRYTKIVESNPRQAQ